MPRASGLPIPVAQRFGMEKKIGEEVDLLKKGALVAVTGLETRSTDKLGQDRYITQVVAQGVEPVQAEK